MKAFAAAFAGHNAALENGWLKSQQIAAFARFEYLGLPDRKQEAWKYTDTRALGEQPFVLAQDYDAVAAAGLLQQALPLDAWRLVFVDGVYAPELSDLEALPHGLQLAPLSQEFAENTEWTGGMMGRLAGIDVDVFTALNAAFSGEGAVLHLAQGCRPEKPVYLLFLSLASQLPVMSHPRILINAGIDSHLQLVEQHLGAGGTTHLTNKVTEIVLAGNARLTHYLLEMPGDQGWLIGRTHVWQKRDSNYACHHINQGGRLVRDDLVCELNGTGASSELHGLLFGRNRQHLDVHTRVDHNAPHTRSYENYKTILDHQSHGVFNGRVMVKRDSQQIQSEQHNANLLLSDEAEIDTKPELEIYADDVKCSHGASTGQLDEDALFYLRARGIDEQQARGLLTLAFANEVVDTLALDVLRQQVQASIAGALPYQFAQETLDD